MYLCCAGRQSLLSAGAVPSIIRLLGSCFARVISAALGAVRNLACPDALDPQPTCEALFKAGAPAMLVHIVNSDSDPILKQVALHILFDLVSLAPKHSTTPTAHPANPSPVAASNHYTDNSIIDELMHWSLPSGLLLLLHTLPPVRLQERAMQALLLLAACRQSQVLKIIRDMVGFDAAECQELVRYTGKQVLQLLTNSTSWRVRDGAIQLLQALSSAVLGESLDSTGRPENTP